MAMRTNAVLRPPPPPRLGNPTGAGAYVEERGIKDDATVTPIFRASRMPTTDAERQLRDMYEQSQNSMLRQATEGAVLAAAGGLGHYSNMAYDEYLKQIMPPMYSTQVGCEGHVLVDTDDHDGRPITLQVKRRVDHRFTLREAGHSYDPSVRGPDGKLDPELMVSNSKYAIPVGSPRIIRDHKEPTIVASFKGVTWVGYTHTESPGAWRRAEHRARRAQAKRERTRRRLGRRVTTFLDFATGKGVLRRPPDPFWFCRNPDGMSPFFGDESPWPLGKVANATSEDAMWGRIARLKTSAMQQFKASPFVYERKLVADGLMGKQYTRVRRLHPDLQAQFDSIEAEVLKNEAGDDLPWSYADDPTPLHASPRQDEGRSSIDSPSEGVGEDLVAEAVSLGIIDWDEVPNPYEVSDQYIEDWGADLSFKVQSKRYVNQVRGAGTAHESDEGSDDDSPVIPDLSGVQSGHQQGPHVVEPEPEVSDPVRARVKEIVRIPSGLVGAVRKGEIEVLTRNSFHRIRGKDEDPLLVSGEGVIDLPSSEWRVLTPEEAANHEVFDATFKTELPDIKSIAPLLAAPEVTEYSIRKALLGGPKHERIKAAFAHLSRVEANIHEMRNPGFWLSYAEADPSTETWLRCLARDSVRYDIDMYLKGFHKSPEGWWATNLPSGHGPVANREPDESPEEYIERVLNMDVGDSIARLLRRARNLFHEEEKSFSALDALRIRRKHKILPRRGFIRMSEYALKDYPGLEIHAGFPAAPHKPAMRTQLEVAIDRYSGTGVAREKGTNRKHTHLLSEHATRLTDEEMKRRLIEATTPVFAPPDWQVQLENAKTIKALVAQRSLSLSRNLDPVEVRAHARMVMPFIAPIYSHVDTPPSKGPIKRSPNGAILM